MIGPYVAQMQQWWPHLAQVDARVGQAAWGSAAVEDLQFLDACAQDLGQVARWLEGEVDLSWQQLARMLAARAEAVEDVLRPHLC